MVYTKYLDSDEARAMAQALLEAADEWDVMKAEQDAERRRFDEAVRRCEQELGGHDWPSDIKWSSDWKCQRCGSVPKTTAFVWP